MEPRGSELWTGADGAVGGLIGSTPRIFGSLGRNPDGDIARVFFTLHFSAVDGAGIVDLDIGARLKSNLTAKVKDGASLRVTS